MILTSKLVVKITPSTVKWWAGKGYKRTLCGVEGGYQLDHIISIKEGFEKNIAPEIIGAPGNLQMLPWRDNLLKSFK